MAEADFALDVVTPEGPAFSGRVVEMTAPGAEGRFGVLPGHRPFFTALDIGELTYRTSSGEGRLAVAAGFAEVLGDRVTVLAETAEGAARIDVERALLAEKRAEARLRAALEGDATVDVLRAELALRRALTRLRVACEGR